MKSLPAEVALGRTKSVDELNERLDAGILSIQA